MEQRVWEKGKSGGKKRREKRERKNGEENAEMFAEELNAPAVGESRYVSCLINSIADADLTPPSFTDTAAPAAAAASVRLTLRLCLRGNNRNASMTTQSLALRHVPRLLIDLVLPRLLLLLLLLSEI